MSDLIMVTGAGGLVGRAVCADLRRKGYCVLPVIHQLADDSPKDSIAIDLVTTDLLANIKSRVSAVVHLAAAVPHSLYYPDTEATALLTRKIDLNVLQAVRQWQCPVVYMSTCGLYDRQLEIVKHEEDKSIIKIESPYFAAKFEGEARFIDESDAIVMRLAAPLGPGLRTSVIVGRFLSQAREDNVIQVWGSGSREQNFVDVEDVASLITQAIEYPRRTLINVASAQPTTMAELAHLVVSVVGKGQVDFPGTTDPREGETARYSIERAEQIYGWRPKCTLRESLEKLKINHLIG